MRAVIFDFDGTIADSFNTVVAIAYHLTKNQKLADTDRVGWMRDNNMGLAQAIKSLNIPKWKWPWLLARGRALMAKQIHQVPVFDGIDDVLKALHSEQFQMFIISSNSRSNVEKFLLEKGLLPYFDKVYGGAGLFNKAKIINKLLKLESLNPNEVIYVGDEVRDIMAAKQSGIPSIAVSWGYNAHDLLAESGPTFVVDSPIQLQKEVIEWGKSF